MQKKFFPLVGYFIALSVYGWGQVADCPEKGTYPMPALSEKAKVIYTENLLRAKETLEAKPDDADALIWYGRRLGYLGEYYDAIDVFGKAIALHPEDARAYRHRGHRWLSLRCFDQAIQDFETAARLTKGKPDEIEPDGLPNAKNIPTSTLQSNIWYHLGLAYYLKKDYSAAEKAYRRCIAVSNNPDMYVATANWYYITLLKLGKTKAAAKLLATVEEAPALIENQDYHLILMLYKKDEPMPNPMAFLAEHQDLSLVSFGYGLGNYLLEKGRCAEARQVFERITASNQWSAFGYIAAEKALAGLSCP